MTCRVVMLCFSLNDSVQLSSRMLLCEVCELNIPQHWQYVVLHEVTNKHCSDNYTYILHLNCGYSFKPHAALWLMLHVESLYTYVKCSWDSDVWWMWLIMVDMARHPRELLRKEAIHIQMTPAEECLNRDTGLELPGCWVAALRRQEDSSNRAGPPPTDRLRASGDRRWCGAQV